jgi:integrase
VRLPVVPTQDEVRRLLSELTGVVWLMASLVYGAGLRGLECVELRVKDLDLAKREIRVRDGNGRKDRVTVIPARLVEPLAARLAETRRLHDSDLRADASWVELPDALGRKHPNAGREIGWQWLFPATRGYFDPKAGQRRRHQLHESVLQRAVKEAVTRAGLTKRASVHTLRHHADASARVGVRHQDNPGAPWTPGRQHDDDLHACPEQGGRGVKGPLDELG